MSGTATQTGTTQTGAARTGTAQPGTARTTTAAPASAGRTGAPPAARPGGRTTGQRPEPPRAGNRSTAGPALPQYSWRQILAVWLAATVPMSVLGWVVAPWASTRFHSRDPLIDALLVAFDVGLIWIIVMVALLVRREQGSLAWSRVREALWLGAPRSPRSGRVGGRVWWWVLPFVVVTAAVNALPIDPIGPLPRDFPHAILTDRVQHYFSGNWVGFGLLVTNTFLAPIAEELVFRGLLLPRLRGVFGRGDAVASATLFTLYHLHQPWCMPTTWLDGLLSQALPSRIFRSTWMGLITHTAPSFLIFGVVLNLVL